MVLIRMLLVLVSSNDFAMAATIATRYSAVRRQTANSKVYALYTVIYLIDILYYSERQCIAICEYITVGQYFGVVSPLFVGV